MNDLSAFTGSGCHPQTGSQTVAAGPGQVSTPVSSVEPGVPSPPAHLYRCVTVLLTKGSQHPDLTARKCGPGWAAPPRRQPPISHTLDLGSEPWYTQSAPSMPGTWVPHSRPEAFLRHVPRCLQNVSQVLTETQGAQLPGCSERILRHPLTVAWPPGAGSWTCHVSHYPIHWRDRPLCPHLAP